MNELERKLRQQVARLKQLSAQQQGGGGAGGAGGVPPPVRASAGGKSAKAASPNKGEEPSSDRVASLQAELAAKQKEVEAKDQELAMLKDMVRARKADARTRELKAETNALAQRRKIRTDAPMARERRSIEISPSSSGTTPQRSSGGVHMMQQLSEDE